MTENEAINYLRQIDPKHIECVELIDMEEVWENIPKAVSAAEKALREIQRYQEIGTVEECRETRERQKRKKPIIKSKKKTKIQTGDYVDVKCPCCEEDIFHVFIIRLGMILKNHTNIAKIADKPLIGLNRCGNLERKDGGNE